jgi:hypothetical protein
MEEIPARWQSKAEIIANFVVLEVILFDYAHRRNLKREGGAI